MLENFIDTIRQAAGGAPSPSEIVPGKLTRFATSDRRGDESGWCKLFDDCEGDVFGCWRQNTQFFYLTPHATSFTWGK